MKAQMFVVTAVFLVMLISTISQALFIYSKLDLPTSFQTDYYTIENIVNAVNRTIKANDTCNEFEQNLKELIVLLETKGIEKGYFLDLNYQLDCSFWNNLPPQPNPLNLSLDIIGSTTSTGNFKFYHI